MEQSDFIRQFAGSSSFAVGELLKKVYLWMTFALAVTGLTALYTVGNPGLMQQIFQGATPWLLIIGELVVVMVLSARIMKMSFTTAGLMFVLYSLLNGLTFAVIFLLYTEESIAGVFFITAGTFAATSLVGYTTKRDLSKMGSFLMMALIGLIIASVVNIFMQSTLLYWIVSYVGVLVFVGLTAYDTQKIKTILSTLGGVDGETQNKIALMGSLTLYLDFINLFLYLLRIFGDRRD